MGTIISSVSDVENIRWTKLLKGRVVNAKRVIVLDDRGCAIIELENGSFTVVGQHHGPNNNWAVLGYGLDHFTQAILHGLVRIGILDRQQIKEHIRTAEQRKLAMDRKQNVKWLKELCEKLGVEPPVTE